MFRASRVFGHTLWFAAAFTLIPALANAAAIHGSILDPTGAVIPRAKVELIESHSSITTVTTDANGQYRLQWTPAPDASLRISAPAFRSEEKALPSESSSNELTVDFVLSLASLSEQITVTSTGTPTPQSQLGTTVTTLSQQDSAGTRDLAQVLSWIPGLQVTQTGQAGGTTSLFIRGGSSDANKLLIDGIPADDIGGNVEFANIASSGFATVEVLRGPNSALYGADALAGVVSLTTPRGSTPLPLLTYQVEGGNFGTYHQEGTLSGTFRKTDYFSDYSRIDSHNALPNNAYHNGTFAGSYGIAFSRESNLRATVRHDQIASGQPNGIELFGIPDDAKQTSEDSYFGATWESTPNPAWHDLLRYGGIRLRSNFTDFAPTGTPQYADFSGPSGPIYDCNPASNPNCFLADYLGAPVTIRGANGYTVSGQALFQYVQSYPNSYATSTDKDFVYAQSDYRFTSHMVGLGAFRYEDERGYSGGPLGSIERGNYSYTVQLQGDLRSRLYYTVGSGLEDNGLFGFAATPRGSLAWQVTNGTQNGLFSGTKLRASFGKGIKEPSISTQTTSLFALLASLPGGDQLIAQYHVAPIGPERSRTYDGGVDQLLARGQGRVSLTLFHNEFTDGMEYIGQQGLIDLGVPDAVAAAAVQGATVNSKAYRAQGVEAETELQIRRNLVARAGYTYVDAAIQRSFTSDAIGPSFNPNFPTVPIGIYSPLIGARPFRIAPHTGYFEFGYRGRRFVADLHGTLVGRRDDSDDLASDATGGTSLLLPNRNLDGAYQRIDLNANYQASRYIAIDTSFQNLLSEHYSEAFGFPSLPFTFRMGMKLTLGGESWLRK
ncbi:MAG TPA: TonB-dependent receptor [Terracidiphilus sp.]|nr:TonB-dependent receptor [Terracidiphilus sp.]